MQTTSVMTDDDLHMILISFYRLDHLILSRSNLVSIPGFFTKLTNLSALEVDGCKNLQEIHEIPSNLGVIGADGCKSLTLQSASVLWSQV